MDIKSLMPFDSTLASGSKIDSKLKELTDATKTAKPGEKDKTENAATDFEALLLKQMFDEMWKTVPDGQMLGTSSEEKQFRDMYTDALSHEIAEKQSIGVKQVLLKDFAKFSKSEQSK